MKLFHFTSAKYALENIEKRRLKIAEIKDLNDPFDLRAPDYRKRKDRSQWNRWRDQLGANQGIICFCRNWKNPVMWSHYADRHRGICLGFEVDDKTAIEVEYQEERARVELTEDMTEAALQPLLFLKSIEWAYEREYRVWKTLTDPDPTSGLYFVPFSDALELREVVVGPLCQVRRAEIAKRLEGYRPHVTLTKARLAFKSFDIVPQRLGL